MILLPQPLPTPSVVTWEFWYIYSVFALLQLSTLRAGMGHFLFLSSVLVSVFGRLALYPLTQLYISLLVLKILLVLVGPEGPVNLFCLSMSPRIFLAVSSLPGPS